MKTAIILFCFIPLCYAQVRSVDEQIDDLQKEVDKYAKWMIEPVLDLKEEKFFRDIYRLPVFVEPGLIKEDLKERPFKHDTYLAINYDIIDTPEEIIMDRQSVNGYLTFHGFDEFYPFLMPKYLVNNYPRDLATSLKEQKDPFRPIFQSREIQPTFNKRFARLMYVIIKKEGKDYFVEIPFAEHNETAPILLHENNELCFQTPYLLQKTGRPYTSFFYIRDQFRVYTWLPFFDNHTNVTYVVQVFVKLPGQYFEMLHALYRQRVVEANKLRHMLLPMPRPMKYVRLHDYYQLPMYENEQLIRQLDPAAAAAVVMPHTVKKGVPIIGQEMVEYMYASTITQQSFFPNDKAPSEQDYVEVSILDENGSLKSLIGVLNDLSTFFTLPITVGNISNYVAYIHFDKHGRPYTWLPFRFSDRGNTFFAQVRVFRSEKFALTITAEQLIAQHGYYTSSDHIPELFKKKNYIKNEYPHPQLYIYNPNYILAVTYSPALCGSYVLRRQWSIRTRCQKSEWLIHGLWYPKDYLTAYRKEECISNNWRQGFQRVENEVQVPEGYRNVSKIISTSFENVDFWDHEWCNNGFFMINATTGAFRFQNPAQYFNLALHLFNYLEVQQRANQFLKSDDNEYSPALQLKQFLESFPARPMIYTYRIVGKEVIAFTELRFCFNSTDSDSTLVPVVCDPRFFKASKEMSTYKRFYYPTSYSFFHFIFLRLRVTKEPMLRILDLRPSLTHAYMHNMYLDERQHHIDAFQEQVYRENARYTHIKQDFTQFWLNEHNEDIFKVLKRIFGTVGILMYDVKERFNQPLDYFDFATHLYKQLDASQWLIDVPYNEFLEIENLRQRLLEKFKVPELSLSCAFDQANRVEYLSEIRVCYSRSKFTLIPCPTIVKYATRDYAGPKQFACKNTFQIRK
ncbi:hypothetical protein B4U80_13413 [Leptotrombidium deliense]|uniref:Uncharacterized protein n=1 Tax=Leptotrombidium deliense TaxID=299467 RepID=A0A443S6W7_9ACAR|nr:hypothetical protein B4U80_13413 [Leptotrombidium deliense]